MGGPRYYKTFRRPDNIVNLYLRLIGLLLRLPFVRRQELFEPARAGFRVWPNDCDLNLHLNNGRYLTFMDLARVHFMAQAGLLVPVWRQRWLPVLSAAEMSFIRPIRPFQRFEIVTRLLTWDEKYFYIEQRFEAGGRLCATGMVKGLFLRGRERVTSAAVVGLLGLNITAPRLPDAVRHWNDLVALKKQHTG